jgi:hypothetical protein
MPLYEEVEMIQKPGPMPAAESIVFGPLKIMRP